MRTTSLMSVAVLAGAFGLATTGWGGSEEISAQSNDATAEPTFGVSLTTDKAIYAAGETIVMELVVFNRSAENLTFDFGSAQHYDFIIEDTEGNSVWTWAEGRMFAQVLGEEVLGPGREQVVYTETFDEPLQPGRYKVTGVLIAANRPMSASVMITIE